MSKYCDIKKLIADTKAGRWWDKADRKTTNKWTSLKHNGVLFPPEYEPLPAKVKILYDGKPVQLDSKNTNNPFNITAEEAAVFFAMKIEQDKRLAAKRVDKSTVFDDKVFIKNFWNDWRKILGKNHIIKSFDKLNFNPIVKFINERSEQKKADKKAMTKDEKEKEKEEKEALKDLYGYALVDDIKIPLGSYMIQPPGLYMGHGKHPKRGNIKARVKPSDVTINVSKRFIPRCFDRGRPCKWGNVVENKEVTWIAEWRHPITTEKNYVWLKRDESHWVCMDDKIKFDKARKLDKSIANIRKKYTKDLSNRNPKTQQLAVAVYFLDKLAIRPGTDKDESKEAGTLGLTTLKCGNVSFKGKNTIKLNFTGKSSIKFDRTIVIDSKVYKIMKDICGQSTKKSLFPDVNSNSLNSYLKTLMKGLTAKNFRTWKASSILQKELSNNVPKVNTDTHEKKLIYDKVNIEVAKALNHKKMTDNQERVKKIEAKIQEYEQKKKEAKTDAAKKRVQKSITLNKSKLEEAKHNISTSTSKVNYLDPRISVAWAKECELPIEKIYNKTQLQKFIWAMETPSDWKF